MRFIAGTDRHQIALLPDCLNDYVAADNPVRAVDAFVDELDLATLGFAGVVPAATGRPGYHPAALLKLHARRGPTAHRAGGGWHRALPGRPRRRRPPGG